MLTSSSSTADIAEKKKLKDLEQLVKDTEQSNFATEKKKLKDSEKLVKESVQPKSS